MIINKENSKILSGNKYIYNLECQDNITLDKLIVKSNLKKNIIFSLIGRKEEYIINLIQDEDETVVNLNIELIKGNNYIIIHSASPEFEINIEQNVKLGIIKFQELTNPYFIETNNYYDLLLKKINYFFWQKLMIHQIPIHMK